ncbi:IclR family transcriptional regulator [Rhodococcus rhodnii]|uniref:IclR family transcriptional regulator n=2 Tax=Rhodococcus rhodnii TaxID=38312 RepID=R7WML4_9NOCA|nr:IclR family transcriptional regulator [Rhodococcus rhodnii]EOM76561.1 IclR family transcriptional regulator [Rhodococcus rhodnii LMG 5362]TXG92168.1 IclR family transcriptional regulator [Rhodococcus rhodnii]
MSVESLAPHPTAPTAVLDRVSSVLNAFDGPGRLTLSDVVRRTGLPRSSAHRMLDQLVQMRWLRRSGRDYELGMGLIELGSLALAQDRVHTAAMPTLHELHRMTGYVVHLAVLDGSDIVYLEKIGGRLGGSVPTRSGGRRPARRTAVGKVLLAGRETADPELAQIRERGIALEREESLRGFGCIAAPIGPAEEAVAAISLCGPIRAMPFDHRLTNPVRAAATRIWHDYREQLVGVAPAVGSRRGWPSAPRAHSA